MDNKQVIKYGGEGYWKHYYPNGKIFSEGLYINGRKEGIWKMYHRNNIIKYIEYFVV